MLILSSFVTASLVLNLNSGFILDTEAFLSKNLDNQPLWETFKVIFKAWGSKPFFQARGYKWILAFALLINR